jgi:hypothetical protein
MSRFIYPGINVQTPWARLLLEQKKQIETRTYPLPEKYVGKDLWLIETPGSIGKFKARIIGIIRFSDCKEYRSKAEFDKDLDLHLIHRDCKEYRWRAGFKKFGWIVQRVKPVEEFSAPTPRGIVFAGPFSATIGGSH